MPRPLRCRPVGVTWTMTALVIGLVAISSTVGAADPQTMFELTVGQNRFSGRVMAHNEQHCWLLHQDGSQVAFRIDDVTDFSQKETVFQPYSVVEMRSLLATELGRTFEVRTTQHYVVAAPKGTADRYAELFEQTYRQFRTYFGSRGFQLAHSEFPLVAVVYPNSKAFHGYCESVKNPAPEGVVGFYMPSSNRIVLYDRVATGNGTSADVDDTVIHEATHQIAFNMGIHSRIGPSPQWVVEGLATTFEAPGIRKRDFLDDRIDRANLKRLEWFRRYRAERRPKNSLEAFVRDDKLFKHSSLDAYSQAWALTFYLVEARSSEFSDYLKTISSRSPFQVYGPDERLADFRKAFGSDIGDLERGLLHFIDKLSQ